ncbi:MAG: hypothetical protein Q4C42_11030 [Clostridia bacterium]|nr:hypothetical protein [Clostridia bacterium]
MFARKAETIYTTRKAMNSKRAGTKSEIVMNDTELNNPAESCFGRKYVNINGISLPTV